MSGTRETGRQDRYRLWFSTFGTIDILGKIILWCVCVWSTALFIVGFVFNHCKILSSNPGFSLIAQTVKNLPVVQETQVRSLDWGDPLEKEMATPSSILAWRIPWIDEPGGLQSTASQKSDMICDETTTTLVFTHYKIVKPTS